MVAELRARGWEVTVHALDASFPDPTPAALADADRVLAGIPSQTLVLVDGLALSAMPSVLRAHAARLILLALIHMPLAADAALEDDPDLVRRVRQAEADALQTARHVFATGEGSRAALLAYGLPAEQISIIEPGTDEAPLARRPPDGMVKMLCVATVQPVKGHDLLVEALAPLASWPWQLTCVGSLTRRPDTVARLRAQLIQRGLSERVALIGEVEPAVLARYFLEADLIVLATRFESYCMAVAEGLAHGLPIVSTRTGAIPDLVGTQAGLLVAPGDLEALRAALAAVLSETGLLASLASGAAVARHRLPRWTDAGARLAQALARLA
ncbi:MAG: glycosyltransferase family 4 protein [Steroidobacteraceae bacterium]